MIPLTKPYFSNKNIKKISNTIPNILKSGRLMMGPWNEKFEKNFSKIIGSKYALSTNSCTTAIQIALEFYKVKGHDVMVPSGSFQSGISAIKWSGANPILVDMNPETLSFSLEDLKKKITKKTKGIIWVHVTGVISSEYKKIVQFAKSNNLFIIEDCAHAQGSSIDKKKAGTLGDVGVFSFFPSKIMTTGSGGMLTTDDRKLAEFTMKMRIFGRNINKPGVSLEGNDWFLDEIRACVGYHQLSDFQNNLKRRKEIAKLYDKAFKNHKRIRILKLSKNNISAYYQYPIFLHSSIDRNQLIFTLKNKYKISTKRIWLPTHQEEIFKNLNFKRSTLMETEKTFDSSLCLPIFYTLKNKEVNKIIRAIKFEI
jgi:perosamine synthetase